MLLSLLKILKKPWTEHGNNLEIHQDDASGYIISDVIQRSLDVSGLSTPSSFTS